MKQAKLFLVLISMLAHAQFEGSFNSRFLPNKLQLFNIKDSPYYENLSLDKIQDDGTFFADSKLPIVSRLIGSTISTSNGGLRFFTNGYHIWDSTQNVIRNGLVYDSNIVRPSRHLFIQNAVEFKTFVPLEEYGQEKYFFIQLATEYNSTELDPTKPSINLHKAKLYYNLIERKENAWEVTKKNIPFFEFDDMSYNIYGISRAFLIKATDGVSSWLIVRNSLLDAYYVFKINSCGIHLTHTFYVKDMLGKDYDSLSVMTNDNNVYFKLYPHGLLTEVRSYNQKLNYSLYYRFNQTTGVVTYEKLFDNNVVYLQRYFSVLENPSNSRPFINKNDVLIFFKYLDFFQNSRDTLYVNLSNTKDVLSENKIDKILKINLSKKIELWKEEFFTRENFMFLHNSLNGGNFSYFYFNSLYYVTFSLKNTNSTIDNINDINLNLYFGNNNPFDVMNFSSHVFFSQELQNQTYYAEGWVTPNLKKWPRISLAGKCTGLEGELRINDSLKADSIKVWHNSQLVSKLVGDNQQVGPDTIKLPQVTNGAQMIKFEVYVNCAKIELDTLINLTGLSQGPEPPEIPGSMEVLICQPPNDEVRLPNPNIASGQTYHWMYMSDTLSPEIVEGEGEYFLHTSNTCGTHVKKMNVFIDSLFVPNIITPNDDGLNDRLLIRPEYIQGELKVFNRWGSLVLNEKKYGHSWHGENVDSGHFFLLYKANEKCTVKNWLQIIK